MMLQCNACGPLGWPRRPSRTDLCAQLATLDRYGPTGLGMGVVDALRSFLSARWRDRARQARRFPAAESARP